MLLRVLRAQSVRALKAGKCLAETKPSVRAGANAQVRFKGTDALNVDPAQLEGGLRGVVGTIALVEKEAVYVEVWIPDGDATLRCGDAWQTNNASDFADVRKIHEQTRTITAGILVDAVNSHHAMWKESNLSANDFPGIGKKKNDYSIAALPILADGKTVAVLALLYEKGTLPPKQQLERIRSDLTIAVSHILTGAEAPNDGVSQDNEEIFDAQRTKVVEILIADGLFSEKSAREETSAFYSLGISPLYFAQHNPVQIAKHLTSYIGAKTAAMTALADMDPTSIEAADLSDMTFHFIGKKEAVFFCLDDSQELESMISRLNQYVDSTEEGLTSSLMIFKSRKPLLHGRALILCSVTRSRFLKNDVNRDDVPDIWSIASASFLRSKSRAGKMRYEKVLQEAHGRLHPLSVVRPRAPGHVMMLVFPNEAPRDGLLQLFRVLNYLGLKCSQLFAETFANGMVTYNVYLELVDKSMPEEKVQRNLISLTRRMSTLAVLPRASYDLETPALGPRAKLYFGCAQMFTYYFMPNHSEDFVALRQFLVETKQDVSVDRLDRLGRTMHKNAVNIERFNRTIESFQSLAWAVYEDFLAPRKPGSDPSVKCVINEALMSRIKKEVVDPVDQVILQCCLLFNTAVLKTNFFHREKAATSFRLKPSLFISSEYPEVPHALFMVVGSSFQGFHIRFRDIARGGIRMIKSPNKSYHKNQQSQFEETYNLAYTQQLKNKDIPEGGSKGTILLNSDAKYQTARAADDAFKMYIDSLFDVVLANDQVVDFLGSEEILFFGPDEGTAGDVVVWAALHAKKRGFKYWKAVTTGKPNTMGGIPHDRYGMTTRSVHQQVLGVLRSQNRKEEEVTKVQTGGPDGDLGSNEILISKDKTVALVDGSGVLYDPEGLNRKELTRLVKARSTINGFNPKLLSKKGYLVEIGEKDRKLPNGDIVDGLAFRNEYHLRGDIHADLFVPCGGRPESVNINNVHKMLDKDGTPRFKYIIEGANLFITRDARRVLEDHGVILMKDATCNKGGVTSSSLEVLAALAMSDDQHNQLMCVKEDGAVPAFYQEYVTEVQKIIEENARLEFEACWREREIGKLKYMTEISDLLSKKINSINDTLQQSNFMRENDHMKRLILEKALPNLLLKEVTMDKIVERVPDAYLLAICGSYFAAHYVYKFGLDSSEACIIDFMQEFVKIAP
ncbi:Glutamate dehydrogenase 2 [Diplonema papillatum]|nr:Glutamate dehydrogenase 2 [Diplonema papillatum]